MISPHYKVLRSTISLNNAGFADWTDFLDADWNRQNEMMQLNMHALAELTYRYGRDMRANGHGRILNISSVASMMAGPYMAMYFCVEGIAFAIRRQWPTNCAARRDGDLRMSRSDRPAFRRLSANMSGRNFFTMTKPAPARQLATYAYRRMMRGSTLAYHGPLTKAGALAERVLPRALTRRIAAFMNGGKPHTLKV